MQCTYAERTLGVESLSVSVRPLSKVTRRLLRAVKSPPNCQPLRDSKYQIWLYDPSSL